jgi:hypothetical protein
MTFETWWESLEHKPDNPQLRMLIELAFNAGYEEGVEDQKWKRKPKKKMEHNHA